MATTKYVKAQNDDDDDDNDNDNENVESNDSGHATPPPLMGPRANDGGGGGKVVQKDRTR
jgi:hypothetical protein